MATYKIFRFAGIITIVFSLFVPHVIAGNVKNTRKSPLAWSLRTVKNSPTANTLRAVKKFSAENGGKWSVRYNPKTGSPEALMGGRSSKRYTNAKRADRAIEFLKDNSSMLNIDTSTLKSAGENSFFGLGHVRYQQYYKGLPVEFAYTKVHITSAGEVVGYQSTYDSSINVNTAPAITAADAFIAANADAGSAIHVSSYTLVIYPDANTNTAYLAWKIRGRSFNGKHIWVYYVDAHSGKVLYSYDDMRRAFCEGGFWSNAEADVYDPSPVPTEFFDLRNKPSTFWQGNTVKKPISDQYVWFRDYMHKTTTDAYGQFCSTSVVNLNNVADNVSGRAFAALKGPYFTVTNFRGRSAHWDNGSSEMQTGALLSPISSPSPYSNNSYISWTGTIIPQLGEGKTFAKQYPVFNTPFEVGSMDNEGLVSDDDEVYLYDSATDKRFGSYIGKRSNPFLGASIENPTFKAALKTDFSGTNRGFSIQRSEYLVLNNASQVYGNATGENGNYNIYWSTKTGISISNVRKYMDASLGSNGSFALDEPNAFYHLNKMRRYFMQFNTAYEPGGAFGTRPANLDGHLDVMVHASGTPDAMSTGDLSGTGRWGMVNAFYDLEKNNMFLGDGYFDGINNDPALFAYRSFALDGTIIRHEYTHYVVHQIYNIINSGEFGAISEALSDYFSISSFIQEGEQENNDVKKNLATVGNFAVVNGRNLSLKDKKLTTSWTGELYNDSQILSQALYSLRKEAGYALGNMPPNIYWGEVPVADLVVWASLFYFPDSFSAIYEAMHDACGRINAVFTGACDQTKIEAAFTEHELINGGTTAQHDDYEASAGGLCKNNNGPECAADISEVPALQARIYPKGDLDYYTFVSDAGTLTAELTLPDNGSYMFHGYMLTLYDAQHNMLAEVIPRLNSSATSDSCYADEPCLSVDEKVNLSYVLPKSGRYYLAVTAAPSSYEHGWGISPENSQAHYTLKTNFSKQGHVYAMVNRQKSSYDNDYIYFDAPVVVNAANSVVIATAASQQYTPAETVFSRVQLWDINGNKLDQANTAYVPESGRLLKLMNTTFVSTGSVVGNVQIQTGFARRYPAVGSVILEVIGKNHMGAEVSLGKSEALNLTATSATFEAYNNILLKGGQAVIRYAVNGTGTLTIKAYTQTGTLVKVICSRQVVAGEQGNVTWDGTNDKGAKVASGIYFVKADGPGLDKVDKVAVVR